MQNDSTFATQDSLDQPTPPSPPLVAPVVGLVVRTARDRAIVPYDLGAAALASGHSLPFILVSPKVRCLRSLLFWKDFGV